MQEPIDDETPDIQCPKCGSFEFDTQECAECGFSYHTQRELKEELLRNLEETIHGPDKKLDEW